MSARLSNRARSQCRAALINSLEPSAAGDGTSIKRIASSLLPRTRLTVSTATDIKLPFSTTIIRTSPSFPSSSRAPNPGSASSSPRLHQTYDTVPRATPSEADRLGANPTSHPLTRDYLRSLVP
ncbi:hypothetical protein B9Z19DRAFT_1086036 [Tuber borchii]|uniref:Uncharacterized protein n=1 Tax=Tuber borchii TaxID=42251 RepID=A0A2T6ZPY6_TUBBO|nr:hypothetical protein B9Z19DRAFT_1086036 [Tuber borchii]